MSDETPIGTLRRIGITPATWANAPGTTWKEDENLNWELTADWLNTHALRDLAYLITEGWAVSIHGRSSRVRVRIYRKAQQ